MIADLDDYLQRPNIVYRTSSTGQEDATDALLAAIAQKPEQLLPGLREIYARNPKFVADFDLTGNAVLQLLGASPIGGYHPGDGPTKIIRLSERHSPRSDLVHALGYSFGFLKTIAPAYRAAHKQGQCVLHLQIYGT